MQNFVQVFGAVGGVVLAIALLIVGLTLFFRLLGTLDRKVSERSPDLIRLKSILDPSKILTIQLSNGSTFDRVRLVGFTDSAMAKGTNVPYELGSMAILEHEDGRRTLVQTKLIRMIEVPPDAPPSP